MNHEQYVRKQLEGSLAKNPCRARTLQRKIIADTLLKYKRNEYGDIEGLLADAVKRVNELAAIGRGTTARKFAERLNVSKTTARLHLLSLDHVVRNESKRPYIYTVGKS